MLKVLAEDIGSCSNEADVPAMHPSRDPVGCGTNLLVAARARGYPRSHVLSVAQTAA